MTQGISEKFGVNFQTLYFIPHSFWVGFMAFTKPDLEIQLIVHIGLRKFGPQISEDPGFLGCAQPQHTHPTSQCAYVF